jgi:hypothetical protein
MDSDWNQMEIHWTIGFNPLAKSMDGELIMVQKSSPRFLLDDIHMDNPMKIECDSKG